MLSAMFYVSFIEYCNVKEEQDIQVCLEFQSHIILTGRKKSSQRLLDVWKYKDAFSRF